MRHIEKSCDWYYELRPQFISIVGLFGVLNQFSFSSTNAEFSLMSQACGFVLLFSAYKITQWRRAFRRVHG